MLSLKERLTVLESDILANPMRISAYHDLPFAIFCYPPQDEYLMRKEMERFKTRLENQGKKVLVISLAKLFWKAIKENDSLESLVQLEKLFGFDRIQETVRTYLSSKDFSPLPKMVLEALKDLDPQKDIAILYRAGALAPNFYRMSVLLNELHGKTMVPLILLYPGSREGESQLRFMNMEGRQAISGYNYRVKVY